MIDALNPQYKEEPQAQFLWSEGRKTVIVTDLKIFGPSCLFGSSVYLDISNEVAFIRNNSRVSFPVEETYNPLSAYVSCSNPCTVLCFLESWMPLHGCHSSYCSFYKNNHTGKTEQMKALDGYMCLSAFHIIPHPTLCKGCCPCSLLF